MSTSLSLSVSFSFSLSHNAIHISSEILLCAHRVSRGAVLWALILLLAGLSIYSSSITLSYQILRGGFPTCPAPAAHLIPGRSPSLSLLPVLRQLPCGSPYSRQVSHSLSHLSRLSSPHSERVPDSQAGHSSQHPYKPSNSSSVCVCGWG